MVSAARRNGVTLICVTLNDKTDWNDHMALFDYGFDVRSGYQSADSSLCIELPCVGGEKSFVPVMGDSDVHLVTDGGRAKDIKRKIYLDSFVYAPITEGETLGRIDYLLDGKVLKTVVLTAADDVAAKRVKKGIFQKIKEFLTYG